MIVTKRRRSRRAAPPPIVPRNVRVGPRRTSLRLEPIMWDALRDIAEERGGTVDDIVTEISRSHQETNLTAAVRVYIVKFYRAKLQQ